MLAGEDRDHAGGLRSRGGTLGMNSQTCTVPTGKRIDFSRSTVMPEPACWAIATTVRNDGDCSFPIKLLNSIRVPPQEKGTHHAPWGRMRPRGVVENQVLCGQVRSIQPVFFHRCVTITDDDVVQHRDVHQRKCGRQRSRDADIALTRGGIPGRMVVSGITAAAL